MEITLLGINGSHRPDKNTRYLIEKTIKSAIRAAKDIPVNSEIINLSELKLEYCKACFGCNTKKCSIQDDVEMVFDKMKGADGIIVGSPVYLYDVSGRLKTLMDRSRGLIFYPEDPLSLKDKIGGAVVVHFVRSAGAEKTVDSIKNWFSAQDILIAGSAIGLSGMKGGVTKDEAGKMFAQILGKKMISLIKKFKFQSKHEDEKVDKEEIDKVHSKMY